MDNYFFFLKILFYLNRTKDFAKRMNCSYHTACADDNTQFIRSQSSQSKTLILIFLLGQILLLASSTRDLGIKLSDCLVCCLCDWLSGRLQMPDWMVDWVSYSPASLLAVDVTDIVVDWLSAWLSGWLS